MTSRLLNRFALCLSGLLTGCCTAGPVSAPPTQPPPFEGSLRPPSDLGRSVALRQRVTAHWGDGQARGFDAALEIRGDRLTLVGLTPMGTPAFVLTLIGGELSFDNRSDLTLPFPPEYIVRDIQRVLFPWGEVGATPSERVIEERRDGELTTRRFVAGEGADRWEVIVRYSRWHAADIPVQADLHHGRYGYRLVIATSEATVLPQ